MESMSASRPPAAANPPRRRFTRVEYRKLVEAGVIKEDEPVELIFGEIVAMSPQGGHHRESISRIHKALIVMLRDRAKVYGHSPIAATEDSEPEPDVYVARLGEYWDDTPSHALLVVEVSNTSFTYDRNTKALLYGVSDVLEYWVVDLVNALVEVRRDRDAGEWRTITTFRRGQKIPLLAFPDVEIDVSEILPPPPE